jgi:ABC-type Fe3+/spermidine/putrescine transport system ATPase subunit
VSGDSVVYGGLGEAGTARAGQAPRAVPAAIEVSHLTKVFGGRTAVSDVSFSVAGGEVFGFLGPNGAGKTTTVRALGTLIAPTSGSAIVAGIPLSAKNGPAIRSRISVMPESPGLYLRLTVLENLQCFAGGRLPRADRRGRGGQEPVSFSWTRVGAILRKELRDYRRNRFVIGTMTALPLLLVTLPIIQLFLANASVDSSRLKSHIGLSLLYMLVIPVTMPSVLSAYSVVGEREQGTLEPVLTTPIRREEFLTAKALAAFVPVLVIAYAVFGIFLGAAALFAHPVIVSAIYAGSHVLVQLLFTPLLAGWAIWVGIAVSTRSTDVRVAQQLSVVGSFPPLIIVALMSLNVITESTALAIGLAAALLAFDLLAWRVVARMFDRERLVTGRPG